MIDEWPYVDEQAAEPVTWWDRIASVVSSLGPDDDIRDVLYDIPGVEVRPSGRAEIDDRLAAYDVAEGVR